MTKLFPYLGFTWHGFHLKIFSGEEIGAVRWTTTDFFVQILKADAPWGGRHVKKYCLLMKLTSTAKDIP